MICQITVGALRLDDFVEAVTMTGKVKTEYCFKPLIALS